MPWSVSMNRPERIQGDTCNVGQHVSPQRGGPPAGPARRARGPRRAVGARGVAWGWAVAPTAVSTMEAVAGAERAGPCS